MADYQVTCITKPNRLSPHEHITHIGNSSQGWRITTLEAIRRIDSGSDRFYVVDPYNPRRFSFVGVIRQLGKAPYLRTYADGDWNDNLLSLSQCP